MRIFREFLFVLSSLVLYRTHPFEKKTFKNTGFPMPGVKRKLGRGKVVMGFRFTPLDFLSLVSMVY